MNKDQLRQLIREEMDVVLKSRITSFTQSVEREKALMARLKKQKPINAVDKAKTDMILKTHEELIHNYEEAIKIMKDRLKKMGESVVKESVLNESVAKIILQQLGGNKFIVMTGAKNFVDHGNKALSFRIGRNSKGINYVKITLKASDTYDMEFGRIQGSKYTVKKIESGVYNDQLQKIFTLHTGLYTSL